MNFSNHSARRERERKELRYRILDAARQLFSEGGEEAVTLRRVAEKIEFSATAIYSHFAHKDALVQELCEAEFLVFGQSLLRSGQTPDAMERLRKVAVSYVDFGLQHPQHYRVLFMRELARRKEAVREAKSGKNLKSAQAIAPEPKEIVSVPAEKVMSPYEHLRQAIFKAMAAGCFKPEYRDVDLIAQTLWSCLHGIVALHLVRAQHSSITWKPIQNVVELSLESLLNGLATASCQIPPTWRR